MTLHERRCRLRIHHQPNQESQALHAIHQQKKDQELVVRFGSQRMEQFDNQCRPAQKHPRDPQHPLEARILVLQPGRSKPSQKPRGKG